MTDYTELVKALRHLSTGRCEDSRPCELCAIYETCLTRLVLDAAAAIEELLSFAHYVADKVTMSDEDWEDYHEAFTEVACRKLVKLGVISIEDDMYVYKRDEPQEDEE